MTALADTLDRAAAFLRALPEGTPEPTFTAVMERPTFQWERFLPFPVRVEIAITWGNQLRFSGNSTSESWNKLVHFDGEQVPPAIVAAIRRVVS